MLTRVTVIGCGLIGGSIVKRLRETQAAAHLSVIDAESVLSRSAALVDAVAVSGSREALALVQNSDLVVLATPVRAIIASLPGVLASMAPHAVVTDTGSSKRAVLDAAANSPACRRFVAGHPMAGREIGGYDASDPALFLSARWFLVTSGLGPESAPDLDALARVEELVRVLGAEPQPCDADSHDRAMAYVSHVPQLISSAVHGAAARAGVVDRAGPGFRDVTRIAGGPSSMWRDIFDTNRQYIAEALGELLRPLLELQGELQRGEPAATERALALLEEAQLTKAEAQASIKPKAPAVS